MLPWPTWVTKVRWNDPVLRRACVPMHSQLVRRTMMVTMVTIVVACDGTNNRDGYPRLTFHTVSLNAIASQIQHRSTTNHSAFASMGFYRQNCAIIFSNIFFFSILVDQSSLFISSLYAICMHCSNIVTFTIVCQFFFLASHHLDGSQLNLTYLYKIATK